MAKGGTGVGIGHKIPRANSDFGRVTKKIKIKRGLRQ